MLGLVNLQAWRTLSRWLRIIAWVSWAMALIGLIRTGDRDGHAWWAAFLVIYGLWLLVELGRKAAERRERARRTADG